MNEEKFAFSGLPNYLEWYKCYDDLSNKEWLDGSELREHKSVWDARTVAKWNFFYRPFGPAIGRPQKKMIQERKADISACETYMRESNAAIALLRERLRRAISRFTIILAILAVLTVWFLSRENLLFVFTLGGIALAVRRLAQEQSSAKKRITELEALLKTYELTIRRSQQDIKSLEGEIKNLLAQVAQPPEATTIDKWLAEEIAELECAQLSEFLSKPISRDEICKHIPQSFGDPRVAGLLVDSWGFLQPTSQKGPFGREGTGLRRAKDDLKEHLATWQVTPSGSPVFRLLFLQYIFPLNKNLNIGSLFYDFVTRRSYGKRFETFQYNHITNYSIREIEPEEEPWIKELGLASMTRLLQGKVPKALTIAVASGNHFWCVLVDEDIFDALNEWMKREEKYKELEASLLKDSSTFESRFNGDEQLISAWAASESKRIEEEMKIVVREKQQILWNSGRTAKAVLAHVRSCVEEYVLRFQAPA
jgi:hypothetical protein